MGLILYGGTLSPFVRKTVAFANEKGLDYELRFAFGTQGDPDFQICSPFRKMPAMRDGDFTLSDSTAIITYLDAANPEPNLIPLDPKERARTIWYEEFGDTILTGCGGKIFFNRVVAPRFLGMKGDESIAAKAQADELPPILDYIEQVLPDSGYLVADRLTLADLAVASPLVNLMHLDIDLDAKKRPKLAAFAERMWSRPSFARSIAAEKAMLGR
jgi:glutathione S-transferase